MYHFKDVYKAKDRASITKVVRMNSLFPNFVSEEDNLALMDGVTNDPL